MIGGTYPHRNHLSRLGLDDRWGVSASKLSEIRRSFDLEERWDPLRSKSSRSLDLLDLLLGLSIEGMTFTATSLSSGWVASSAIMARTPAPRTCVVTASITVGGASSIAGSGWVGGVGVLAARSPAPQRLTGVRESTAPSLVASVELSPAGSVPADVMDPALAPPPTGASDGS